MWLNGGLAGGLANNLGGFGEKYIAKIFKLYFLYQFPFNFFETSMQFIYKY